MTTLQEEQEEEEEEDHKDLVSSKVRFSFFIQSKMNEKEKRSSVT